MSLVRVMAAFGMGLALVVGGAAWGQEGAFNQVDPNDLPGNALNGVPSLNQNDNNEASERRGEIRPLPGLPAGPENRPLDGEMATEPVDIYFDGVELREIVKAIGAMTGRNFLFDPQIGNIPVTLVAHTPIQPRMLLPLLQSVLTTYGFSMRETLEDGALIKIGPISDDWEKHEIITDSDVFPEGYDEFSTHIVQVRYGSAEELTSLVRGLGSQEARVDAYGPANMLIIRDNAHGVRNMLKFLDAIDVPGSEIVTEIFSLEYARAEVLAAQLEQVLLGGVDRTRPQQARAVPQPGRPPVRPAVRGDDPETIISAEEPVVQIVPDERLNTLIVRASEAMMREIRTLIDRLDSPTPYDANNMHVYELQNANAEVMKSTLTAIIGGAPRAGGEGGGGGGVNPATGEIQPFERRVVVENFDATNSLLILASPQDYKVISTLIEQLDIPQRQVHVEAIIMEVIIQDRFELSVEMASLTGHDGFAVNNIVQLANVLSGGPLFQTGADAPVLTTGVLDGTIDIPVTGPNGQMTVQTVPKVPLLLTALDSVTDLDVLSQPFLPTVDNEEASIIIGDEVPVTTGTRAGLDQVGADRAIFSSIDRRDVGIKMTVTPQISQGDYVAMNLDVEVSSVKQSPAGADPNIVGPTFSKSQVTNRIVVRDGATGVVGGLISETTDRSRRQTPILGDLPVLGWMFRRTSNQRAKRNLVVLVTPHVIRDGRDADRLMRHRIDEFSAANLDAIFEQGFIRKTERRHYKRTRHRPSEAHLETLHQEGRFERGDMER